MLSQTDTVIGICDAYSWHMLPFFTIIMYNIFLLNSIRAIVITTLISMIAATWNNASDFTIFLFYFASSYASNTVLTQEVIMENVGHLFLQTNSFFFNSTITSMDGECFSSTFIEDNNKIFMHIYISKQLEIRLKRF